LKQIVELCTSSQIRPDLASPLRWNVTPHKAIDKYALPLELQISRTPFFELIAMKKFSVVQLQCANQTFSDPCKLEGLFACKNCKLVAASFTMPTQKRIFHPDTYAVLWASLPNTTLAVSQGRVQRSSQ
jgi:hypothetical protein